MDIEVGAIDHGVRTIARSGTLKRINMRRFLNELRRTGPSTRAELTRATGVAPPTSSTIIAELLDAGLIEEVSSRLAARGRPGKVFRLASSSAYLVAASLGPEMCVMAPAGLDARTDLKDLQRFDTPTDYPSLLTEIVTRTQGMQMQRTGSCAGLGLSVPGLVDERNGRVAFSPNLHITDGRDLGHDLSKMLDMEVVCFQEEHALCLGEQNFGGAKSLSDFAVLDISYGMGMGVVSGGRYLSGKDGFAGEIGHVIVQPNGLLCGCGNRGCMETVATDNALLNAVRAKVGRRITFDEMQTFVDEGTLDIACELDEVIDYLGIAVAAIANIFNPCAIYISGRMIELSPLVPAKLNESARSRILSPSRSVEVLAGSSTKLNGAFAGMLDRLFASIGPVLE